MKKILYSSAALILCFTILSFIPDDFSPLSIGSSLPKGDLKIADISGKEITLNNSKKENGLLVVFSCNTCPFVVKQEASILEVGKVCKESNIGYVVINSNEAQRDAADSFDAMKKYAKKQGYDFHYAMDANTAIADACGATRTPEAFLFDKNMKLVYKGAFSDDTDPKMAKVFYLKDALTSLRDGKAIAVNTTKSVGCTIKRLKREP